MVFLHIDTKNYEDKNEKGENLIDKLNKFINKNNSHVFILYYMEGCGPCNATRPEWKKLKNVFKKYENDENIIIVDIDQILSSKLKGLKEPTSFPTIRYITNNGNYTENYEDSEIKTKDRTIDSFSDWINIKTTNMKGGKKREKRGKGKKVTMKKKNVTKRKNMKAGKWSLKYKKSINCNKPKGFSQRQYCKYSRNKK
jgi:hypothetical protein